MKVSYGGKFTNIAQNFLDVAQQFDKTREVIEDPNQIYKSDAYGVSPSTMAGSGAAAYHSVIFAAHAEVGLSQRNLGADPHVLLADG